MRLKDFSGAQVCTLAWVFMVSRIWVRVVGWKISGARRFWRGGVSGGACGCWRGAYGDYECV